MFYSALSAETQLVDHKRHVYALYQCTDLFYHQICIESLDNRPADCSIDSYKAYRPLS